MYVPFGTQKMCIYNNPAAAVREIHVLIKCAAVDSTTANAGFFLNCVNNVQNGALMRLTCNLGVYRRLQSVESFALT